MIERSTIQYSKKEEMFNVGTHVLGVFLSIIGTAYLLHKSATTLETISYSIFGLSLIALYSASTLYHFVNVKQKPFFKKLDHICIYYLIAGSYTPFLFLTLQSNTRIYMAIAVWVIALGGTLYKIFDKKKNKILSVSIYLLMGWLIVFAKDEIMQGMSQDSFKYLFIGGLFYTLGVPIYLLKKVPYHHGVWHLMVLAGSISHYLAVFYL